MEEFQGKKFSAELKVIGTWKRLVKTQDGGQWVGYHVEQSPGRSASVAKGLEMGPSYIISAIEFSTYL